LLELKFHPKLEAASGPNHMLLAPAIYFNPKWEELHLSAESDRLVKHLSCLKILIQMKKHDPKEH
jgi:hypothetical protein